MLTAALCLVLAGSILAVSIYVQHRGSATDIEAETMLGTNMSFESGLTDWTYVFDPPSLSGALSTTTTDCHTGTCAVMTAGSGTNWQFIKQSIGQLEPTKDYRMNVWFKTSAAHQANVAIVDMSWKDGSGVVAGGGKGFWHSASGTGDWSQFTNVFTVPATDDFGESTATHTWYIYLAANSPSGNYDTIAYDDIAFSKVSFKYVRQYGCLNDASAKCIDFGSAQENESGGTFTAASMGAPQVDGATSYRSINSKSTLTISLPAFDVDANGLPNHPMVLETHYKDTIDSSVGSSGQSTQHRAFIDSKIDYLSDDPLVYYHDKSNYRVSYLGENGDGTWKFNQFVFQKTDFQLIRSIGGTFTFRIVMPALVGADDTLTVPMDYVALQTISDADAQAFTLKQRDLLGFYQTTQPTNRTACATCNADLTAFAKDGMDAIYEDTIPLSTEVDKPLAAYTALGEIEPLNLGLYSKNGIQNLSIQITDLVAAQNGGGTATIQSSAVETFALAYGDTTLNPYGFSKAYSRLPDRLVPLTTLNLAQNTSQQVWIKVHVPTDAQGGVYHGSVNIIKDGSTYKQVPINLSVLPIHLSDSPAINTGYHEPDTKVYASSQESVMKFYRELGLDPFIYRNLGPEIKNGSNVITGYNTATFESALDGYITSGIVHRNVEIETSSTWMGIYASVYGQSVSPSTLDLYAKLDAAPFRDAFGLAIQKYQQIAAARNLSFIYSVTDEPGTDPYQRILADRLYSILEANGVETAVTYYTGCETVVNSGSYVTPTGSIPALQVDYKVWHPEYELAGYNEGNAKHAFYTTYLSNERNPIYNRFMHGLFAYRVGAKMVSAYAVGDLINDPYNDFDQSADYINGFTYPDFLMGYPSWSGSFVESFNSEGIREGIKDSRFIATLESLIVQHAGTQGAIEAQGYLDALKARISPDLWGTYVSKAGAFGYYQSIIADVSSTGSADDYAAFTSVRDEVVNRIMSLASINLNIAPDPVTLSFMVPLAGRQASDQAHDAISVELRDGQGNALSPEVAFTASSDATGKVSLSSESSVAVQTIRDHPGTTYALVVRPMGYLPQTVTVTDAALDGAALSFSSIFHPGAFNGTATRVVLSDFSTLAAYYNGGPGNVGVQKAYGSYPRGDLLSQFAALAFLYNQ